MRNLYMYYKRLKQYITRKQQNPDSGVRANSAASGRTAGSSALSGVSQPSNNGSVVSGSSAFSGEPEPKVGNGPKNEPLLDLEEVKGGPEAKKDLELTKALADELMRKYNISNLQHAEKKLKEIKGERKDLRGKLDSF